MFCFDYRWICSNSTYLQVLWPPWTGSDAIYNTSRLKNVLRRMPSGIWICPDTNQKFNLTWNLYNALKLETCMTAGNKVAASHCQVSSDLTSDTWCLKASLANGFSDSALLHLVAFQHLGRKGSAGDQCMPLVTLFAIWCVLVWMGNGFSDCILYLSSCIYCFSGALQNCLAIDKAV